MNQNIVYKSLLLFVGILFSIAVGAQRGDTLSPYRTFLKGSRAYQQLPLQLELRLQSRSNFITSPEDSFDTEAQFFMQASGSYVRYGEVEQLTNDSLALLVNTATERMILYNNARPVLQQMQTLLIAGVADSSVVKVAAAYEAKTSKSASQETIELTSRTMLPGTVQPKQVITLELDKKSGNPLWVATLRRTLVVLSEEDYEAVKGGQPADKLLAIPGKGYYLIKEVRTLFEYRKISHDERTLPVRMEDRIHRSGGEYQPAKGYENYGLSLN